MIALDYLSLRQLSDRWKLENVQIISILLEREITPYIPVTRGKLSGKFTPAVEQCTNYSEMLRDFYNKAGRPVPPPGLPGILLSGPPRDR